MSVISCSRNSGSPMNSLNSSVWERYMEVTSLRMAASSSIRAFWGSELSIALRYALSLGCGHGEALERVLRQPPLCLELERGRQWLPARNDGQCCRLPSSECLGVADVLVGFDDAAFDVGSADARVEAGAV